MNVRRIKLPLSPNDIKDLAAGDTVSLNGILISGRDAAHKKLIAALAAGERLPIELEGETLFYVGPCPTPPGRVIGSAGPTTSGRMDSYTPRLLELGLKGMVGKGQRSPEVIAAMIKWGAVYFAALGGAGALYAQAIKKAEVIAYPELGPEAIYRLEVADFPVTVAVDSQGNDFYQIGKSRYQELEAN